MRAGCLCSWLFDFSLEENKRNLCACSSALCASSFWLSVGLPVPACCCFFGGHVGWGRGCGWAAAAWPLAVELWNLTLLPHHFPALPHFISFVQVIRR